MKVPLTAYYTHQLLIMHKKRLTKIPAPMMPYILTTKKSKSAAKNLKLIDLGSKTEKNVYVYEFRSDADAAEKAISLKNLGHDVSYLRFLEAMFVDHPDFFRKYENGMPDVMAFDIEVLTNGSGIFPNPNNNPIICIGAKYMDEPEVVFEISLKDLKRPYPDERIIIEFLEYFREKNPDILITYNGRRFDIPFLITRSQYCGINLSDFSRIPSNWEDKETSRIPGHVHYDIFNTDTDRDQSMLGIKNKKLKTVAEWFKIPHEELTNDELTNTEQLIGTEKLREYQKSDVNLLWELYKIYMPLHLSTAEIMGIPLEFIINDYPSFVPKIMSARKLRSAGYIPLDSNFKRYHELEGKYQAAYVDILKHGFISKVYKLDFSGFYPSTMVNFGLSPETTKLVKMMKFTNEDDFKFKLKNNQLWLQIPDKNLQKNLIIRVDQSKPGLISDELRLLMDNRFKLKAKIKDASLDEANKIKAITDTLKVQINSIYGIQGLGSTEYGDLSTAIAIVGICRWIIKQLVDKYRDKVIEVDSVTGQTPICIRRDQKYVDFVPIEELIPKGYHRYYNIPKNIEVFTRNGWKGINYVKRHKVQKQIYRINTTNGYVEATEDHSLFHRNGQEVTPKNLFPQDEIEIKALPKSELDTDISEDFAWFLGFLLAEGSVTIDNRPRYQVVFSNQNLEYLNRINKIFESRYMVNMHLYDTMKSSNCYKLEKDHKFAATELKHLCYTKGNWKKVPLPVLNGTEKIKKAFLKGLWDGDGYINITKKQHIESIDSIHHTLFAGIQYILNSAGQESGVIIRDDKINILTLRKKMSRSHNVSVNQHLVKKIKKLTSESTEVYDISTEDGTFVCGIGGIVLHNTDGVYIDSDINVKDAEKFIYNLIRPITSVKDLIVNLDREVYGSGYFHLSKNYLYRELKEGRIIFHGVAFKSSRHCLLYDKILTMVADMILEEEGKDIIWEAVSKYMDLEKYPLNYFIMTTRINKPIFDYINENCLQRRLAEQARKALEIEPYLGMQIEYVVTKGKNYNISALVTDKAKIDHKYYVQEIYKALKLFGLEEIHQNDLFGGS